MIQVDKEFSTTEAKEGGSYVQPTPGGYTLQVVEVSEKPSEKGNAMVTLSLDIADGEFEGAFEKYPKKVFQLVNGEHLPYFKAMLKYFKDSNSEEKMRGVLNQQMQFDAMRLKGCLVGGVVGEAEYVDKQGQIQIGVEVRWLCALKDIANVKPPKLKKLSGSRPAASRPSNAPLAQEDDLPF